MGTKSTCSLLLLCAVTLDVVVLRQVTPNGGLVTDYYELHYQGFSDSTLHHERMIETLQVCREIGIPKLKRCITSTMRLFFSHTARRRPLVS